MDEERISELFAAAARQAPPPGFDETDVRAESARVTARHRRRLAGGVMALVVFAGVGTSLGVATSSNDDSDDDSIAIFSDTDDDAAPELGIARDLAAPVPPGAAALAPEQAPAGPVCGSVDADLVMRLLGEIEAHGLAVQGSSATCTEGVASTTVTVAGGLVTLTAGPSPGLQRTRPDGSVITLSSSPAVPGQPAPLEDSLPEIADALAR